MVFFSKIIIFLLLTPIYESNAYPFSNNEIMKTCQKERKKSFCIKKLKLKRIKLLQGNQIEIPVFPYKR